MYKNSSPDGQEQAKNEQTADYQDVKEPGEEKK